jgi:hypothetical protein
VTALWFTLGTLAAFAARPQNLNQPYKMVLTMTAVHGLLRQTNIRKSTRDETKLLAD